MPESAVAVMKAAAVVHQNSGAPALFGPPAPMTSAPMIEGNIIRFSVYSRNRREGPLAGQMGHIGRTK
jgi:hypothetical protein